MTVKDFLKDIKRKNASLDMLKEQLEKLRSMAVYKSPVMDDIGGFGSPNVHSKEDLYAKIAETSEKLDQMQIELIDDIRKATEMIMSLKDARTLQIFSMRYLQYQTWESIADSLDITFQWVHKLHGRGLRELSERYKNFLN